MNGTLDDALEQTKLQEERKTHSDCLLHACRVIIGTAAQLRVSQIAFLLLIDLRPGITSRQAADYLDVSESATSRNIDIFSDIPNKANEGRMLGFVTEKKDKDDRRLRRVWLTAKGRTFIETIHRINHGSMV